VRLREQLIGDQQHENLTVTLASTDQIRGYFLVHSAFVPGITSVYSQLLEDDGVELVRLLVNPMDTDSSELTMPQLIRGLAHRGVVPLAIEALDGTIHVAPSPEQTFIRNQVRAIFALAERSCLTRIAKDTRGATQE
jgi:hypothetical protein